MSNWMTTPRAAARRRRRGLAVLASASCLLIPGPAASGDFAPLYTPGKAGSSLGTADQIARDRRALRIYASKPVQDAIQNLATFLAQSKTGAAPDATVTLKRAAEATGMGNAASAVNKDPDRPAAFWSVTAAHAWGAVRVPYSGLMIDNPDNIYRSIPIDGAARYEIRGKVKAPAPAQVTFVLHNEASGVDSKKVRDHEEEMGSVALADIPLKPDGSFVITVDNSLADGRPNHLQSRPEDRMGYILVRDTLSDWVTQNPLQLQVTRLAGPPLRPAATEAALAKIAAARTESTGRYWVAWARMVMLDRPVNTYTHHQPRVTGWGLVECGHYRLADDEGLLVRLERRQAAYLGFQLSDVWGMAAPYVNATGSLNQSQARPNADGSFTYVISVSDPGVHNWLDPSGLHAGTFCTRWQGLARGVSMEKPILETRVVKLSDLKAQLPAETSWVTPEERGAEMKARAASYARRLTE